MSKPKATGARVRVERGIYSRINRDGRKTYSISYRDSTGRQCFETVGPKISAARARRDSIIGDRASGTHIQPNPRLKFTAAADRWLSEKVVDHRPATQQSYRGAIENHLRPRWGHRRLDRLTPDDAARLIRELRAEGKAESTIETVCKAARQVFSFARRRMNWRGDSPFQDLEASERPKLSQAARRRIFEGTELAETIGAVRDPWRTLFAFAATTGARQSECLGLVWGDLDLADLEQAEVTFSFQVDRSGVRRELKTEESCRTVELPRSLAVMLAEHKARSAHSQAADFVFATRSGRAISQRNASRELRNAMKKARKSDGTPTFPVLHAVDQDGKKIPVPAKSLPSFHGFRHTAASEAIRDGESAEEVSWQLGHRDSTVTRKVYLREIRTAERSTRRREKFEARAASFLSVDRPTKGFELDGGPTVVSLPLESRNGHA